MRIRSPNTRGHLHQHQLVERRQGERRAASADVEVDRRRDKDRRKGHRWMTGRAKRARYVTPETGAAPATQTAVDLAGETLKRMAASWRRDVGDSISVEEACGLREALITAIEKHDRGEAPDPQLQSFAGLLDTDASHQRISPQPLALFHNNPHVCTPLPRFPQPLDVVGEAISSGPALRRLRKML